MLGKKDARSVPKGAGRIGRYEPTTNQLLVVEGFVEADRLEIG
jgi:hypothetical protein